MVKKRRTNRAECLIKNKARRPMLQTIGKWGPCPNEILMRNKNSLILIYKKINQSSKS